MNHQTILQMARAAIGSRVSDLCSRISMKTQLMAADFPANGVCFSMRPGDAVGTDTQVAFLESLRLQFTCIDAFTDPLFAGRSLIVAGGFNSPATAGGTQLVRPFTKQQSQNSFSIFQQNIGGDVWISDTAELTGPIIRTDDQLAELSLAGYGNAGATIEKTFVFEDPIAISRINPAYAVNTDLLIYSPLGMDPGGTWELVVECDLCQLPGNLPVP
jgi:hypothetical protein